MKTIIFSIIFSTTLSTLAFAHDGEKHEKQDSAMVQTDSSNHEQAGHDHQEARPSNGVAGSDGNITASWDEFPNLHPLIVHFPIVLLILVCIVLVSSAYTVSMAGHHGSQLVFIEGVGPQGKFLETDHHH